MNLFKGLMFLEGHFTRPDDIDDFAPLGNRRAGTSRQERDQCDPDTAAAPTPGLLTSLLLLGGRPMHAGHNLDLDDPFEPLAPSRFTAPMCDLATLRAACD